MGGEGSFPGRQGTAVPSCPCEPPAAPQGSGNEMLEVTQRWGSVQSSVCPSLSPSIRSEEDDGHKPYCALGDLSLSPRASLWLPGMSLKAGGPADFKDGCKQGKELGSSGGRILPPGVEQDKAVTQPQPSSLPPLLPSKAPAAPGDRGVQPGLGPHVWVSVAAIAARS